MNEIFWLDTLRPLEYQDDDDQSAEGCHNAEPLSRCADQYRLSVTGHRSRSPAVAHVTRNHHSAECIWFRAL